MNIPKEEFQKLLDTKTYVEIGVIWGKQLNRRPFHENTVKYHAKKNGLIKRNLRNEINITG